MHAAFNIGHCSSMGDTELGVLCYEDKRSWRCLLHAQAAAPHLAAAAQLWARGRWLPTVVLAEKAAPAEDWAGR